MDAVNDGNRYILVISSYTEPAPVVYPGGSTSLTVVICPGATVTLGATAPAANFQGWSNLTITSENENGIISMATDNAVLTDSLSQTYRNITIELSFTGTNVIGTRKCIFTNIVTTGLVTMNEPFHFIIIGCYFNGVIFGNHFSVPVVYNVSSNRFGLLTFNNFSNLVFSGNKVNSTFTVNGSSNNTSLFENNIVNSNFISNSTNIQTMSFVGNRFQGMRFAETGSSIRIVGNQINGSLDIGTPLNRNFVGNIIISNNNLTDIDIYATSVDGCVVSGNNILSASFFDASSFTARNQVIGNKMGTGFSYISSTISDEVFAGNYSSGALTFTGNLSEGNVRGNGLGSISVSGTTIDSTFMGNVTNNAGIAFTGQVSTTTVQGNNCFGSIACVSTNNTNVVTGNRNNGTYTGWTTFGTNPARNDLYSLAAGGNSASDPTGMNN